MKETRSSVMLSEGRRVVDEQMDIDEVEGIVLTRPGSSTFVPLKSEMRSSFDSRFSSGCAESRRSSTATLTY
jgi:hypothetical protein